MRWKPVQSMDDIHMQHGSWVERKMPDCAFGPRSDAGVFCDLHVTVSDRNNGTIKRTLK